MRLSCIKDRFKARAAALVAAVVLACVVAAPARAEVVDKIVAIINDTIITLSELDAAAAIAAERLGKQGREVPSDREGLKERILDELIRQKLVKQAADRAGIDVSEQEIDNAIDDIKRQNGNMTQEQLMVALAGSGLTYREYREQLKEQIRQVKFVNAEFRSKISIQDSDIEEYYRQHIEDFYDEPRYRIRVLMVSSGDPGVLEKRQAVVEEGLAEGRPFQELARLYSDGPNPREGGDLGYLSKGELDEKLEGAALALEPGSASGWIEKPEGLYMVQLVEELKSEPVPLDQVRGFIHDKLYKKIMDDRFGFWLEEQKNNAHIEIRL